MLSKTINTIVNRFNYIQIKRLSNKSFNKFIDIDSRVQKSLKNKLPIVALESTIITHGMPYPENLQTAQQVEELVKANGATPATIAIIDGRIKVGCTENDLKLLATKSTNEVKKCSRRDLAYILANNLSGGTTVSATMIIAHMTGIRIFATGGIGGVHRDGHITMDVSADLNELSRTPVTVICSGIKSILDIPRTLEYLETQGVCVATFESDDCLFPDFYTRDSGCHVQYNLQGPIQAAELINAQRDLNLMSGILIGAPIPVEFAADKQLIDVAISQALSEANEKGIIGKDVTPFVLSAVAKITKGNSLKANIALIKNNATIAAKIAKELYKTEMHDNYEIYKELPAPLVIGASILDISLTMQTDFPDNLIGATFQTQAKQSGGGVGRNLAEALYKLYGKVYFISAIGADQLGKNLLNLIPLPLRDGIHVDETNDTSLCSVIFDRTGDCKICLANMQIHDAITSDLILKYEEQLASAPLIVIDGNLSAETMITILKLSQKYERPVFFEPTDMHKSDKPFMLPQQLYKQIKFISPNIYELKKIVETITCKKMDWIPNINMKTEELLKIVECHVKAIQHHFDCIVLTLGHHGVLLSLRGGDIKKSLFNSKTAKYCNLAGEHKLYFYAAPSVDDIVNVSGAGDSLTSGFISGLLRGESIERAIALGFSTAAIALQTTSAVPDSYFNDENAALQALENTLKKIQKN